MPHSRDPRAHHVPGWLVLARASGGVFTPSLSRLGPSQGLPAASEVPEPGAVGWLGWEGLWREKAWPQDPPCPQRTP